MNLTNTGNWMGLAVSRGQSCRGQWLLVGLLVAVALGLVKWYANR